MDLTCRSTLLMIPPMNGITAYALGIELGRTLAGSSIKRIVRFMDGATISLDGGPFPYMHVLLGRETELFPYNEPIMPSGRCTDALEAVRNLRIKNIRPLGLDRVLLLELEAADGWGGSTGYILRVDLTPASWPVTLFRSDDGRITDSIGSTRAAAPTGPDETPKAKTLSIDSLPPVPPDEFTEPEWDEAVALSARKHTREWRSRRGISDLLMRIGGMDPALARALPERLGGIADIWPHLAEIGGRLGSGDFEWRICDIPHRTGGRSTAVYPVRVPVFERCTEFDGYAETFRRFATDTLIPFYIQGLRNRASASARRELKRMTRLKKNLSTDLSEAERFREFRHMGNLLVTYRHMLKAGLREIEVPDFSGDRKVKIPLDPSLSPDRNIAVFFSRAKKGEKGILIIKSRRREAERRIDEQRDSIERIGRLERPEEILDLIPSRPIRAAAGSQAGGPGRFRRFVLDERHILYIGRNNRENDILTHRFASPKDMWFHAQGVPGSHVILRGANPSTPKRLLEKAAAAAAYFSKARHSKTVPVIFTEKRYVRKPRKSPPGTAACRREKTLFVHPSLPEDDGPRQK